MNLSIPVLAGSQFSGSNCSGRFDTSLSDSIPTYTRRSMSDMMSMSVASFMIPLSLSVVYFVAVDGPF